MGAGAFGAAVVPSLNFEWASHSVPLSILVEDGIVGLLIFLAMFGATITALRAVPRLPRRFGIMLLLTLGVGSLSLELGYRKQFWFVLGIVAAEAAATSVSARQRPRVDRRVGPTEGGGELGTGPRPVEMAQGPYDHQ